MFQLRNSSTTVANLRHTRAIHISLIVFLLYLTITADEVVATQRFQL